MDYLIEDYINDYKQQNNITRLKSTLKEELTRQAKQTPLVEKLETFYKEL
jgi:GTP1/Obg family GTP-binding protein